jgi:hypothetical protein
MTIPNDTYAAPQRAITGGTAGKRTETTGYQQFATGGGGGAGNVVGPASAVDSDIVEFDTTTGKLIKDGGITHAQLVAAINAAKLVGYREGMIVTVKDATNLYVDGGALEINGDVWQLSAQTTVPMGTTDPDTLYYLYASVAASVWTFTVSLTVPLFSDTLGAAYMTGDTTKRWLANVRTAA